MSYMDADGQGMVDPWPTDPVERAKAKQEALDHMLSSSATPNVPVATGRLSERQPTEQVVPTDTTGVMSTEPMMRIKMIHYIPGDRIVRTETTEEELTHPICEILLTDNVDRVQVYYDNGTWTKFEVKGEL